LSLVAAREDSIHVGFGCNSRLRRKWNCGYTEAFGVLYNLLFLMGVRFSRAGKWLDA